MNTRICTFSLQIFITEISGTEQKTNFWWKSKKSDDKFYIDSDYTTENRQNDHSWIIPTSHLVTWQSLATKRKKRKWVITSFV